MMRTGAVEIAGSLRSGQFTILELEKQSVDDSWTIAASTSHQQLPLAGDADDDEADASSVSSFSASQW